jgi:3-oxoadipate enol-lactonase
MSEPLAAVEDGDPAAPPVLLLGSLGSTVDMWEPQLAPLAARYRVVRADHRGHGGSPVPPGPYALDDLVDDVVALLDRLGIARAHVVGLSLGGMVGMRLAAREPGRVDRLAVLCTSALLGPASGWTERAAAVRAGGTVAVADAVVGRWLTPAGQEPGLLARLRAMVAGTPPEGYAGCCEAIGAMDLRADLPRPTTPRRRRSTWPRSPTPCRARGCSSCRRRRTWPTSSSRRRSPRRCSPTSTRPGRPGTRGGSRCAGRSSATRTSTARSPRRRPSPRRSRT